MIGGIVRDAVNSKDKKQILVQELLVAEKKLGECCVVFSKIDADIKRGDIIWWQSGYHYVTRPSVIHANPFECRDECEFVERQEEKLGYSCDWKKS